MPDEEKKEKKDEAREAKKDDAGASEQKPGDEAAKQEAPASKKKSKGKKLVSRGIVHIQATFNNTIITITDLNGETLCWSSAGSIGYKGSRKSTPFAAQKAAEAAADKAMKFGVREVEVRISGPGAGREGAIRALHTAGLEVRAIEDVTPLPHNGCRPKKKRRV